MDKKKKKEKERRYLTSTQEVLYTREFKQADRAAKFKSDL
jgi:YfhE-like protein